MITDIFLQIILFILQTILFIFPASEGFNSETITAITTIGGYTTIINALVPMDTLGQIFGLVVAFEVLVFTFKGLKFILGYVPFVGGRG